MVLTGRIHNPTCGGNRPKEHSATKNYSRVSLQDSKQKICNTITTDGFLGTLTTITTHLMTLHMSSYLRDNNMIPQSVTPQKLPLGDSGIIPRLPRSVFLCQGQVLMFNDVISSILMPGDLRGRVGAVRRQGNPNRGPASRVTEFCDFGIILLSLRYIFLVFMFF